MVRFDWERIETFVEMNPTMLPPFNRTQYVSRLAGIKRRWTATMDTMSTVALMQFMSDSVFDGMDIPFEEALEELDDSS
jgi:hypothetical protein